MTRNFHISTHIRLSEKQLVQGQCGTSVHLNRSIRFSLWCKVPKGDPKKSNGLQLCALLSSISVSRSTLTPVLRRDERYRSWPGRNDAMCGKEHPLFNHSASFLSVSSAISCLTIQDRLGINVKC